MRYLTIFLCTIFLFVHSKNTFALNKKAVSGQISGEFFNNHTYLSDNKKNEYNKSHIKLELDLSINITDHFSISTISKLEEIYQESEAIRRNQLAKGGGDSSFENEGLFLETLTLNYDRSNFGLSAGKFTLNFGQAWNWKKNIWSYDLTSSNYEYSEKLGLGSYFKIGDEKTQGQYIFSFNIFTNDSKNTDNSIITKRDTNLKSSSNAGNERGFSSFATSLDINYDFDQEEKLSYHFSFVNLAINERQTSINPQKIDDEKNFAASINYKYPFSKNLTADALIEYVKIDNLEGNIDKEAHFITTNLSLEFYKNWQINFARTKKAELEIGTNGTDTKINELSIGYKFSKNSLLENFYILIGYKQDEINDKINKIKDNTIGAMLRYRLPY